MSPKLEARFKKQFSCDTVRISKPLDVMFLIIGFNRNTKADSKYYWSDSSGERIDFDYIEEHTIASGKTLKDLVRSANLYEKLSKITIDEYLKYYLDSKPLIA